MLPVANGRLAQPPQHPPFRRYRIERELGAGGMATVYLAHDLKHDRKVAIKVLRPELAAVIGAARFLREIKTIATLQHPHILGLIDSGEVDGTAYYVMPFVEGESLRDRLNREKQLPIADAVRLATEVAAALDYAHRHGVIHRDIKPENIMLHDGSALVTDFGIALAVSSAGGAGRMTETGMSLGTPHYMSPKQAMGEREITARSDIYALGCVLYEMLTVEPPFEGATAQAIVARVLTESPRLLGRSVLPIERQEPQGHQEEWDKVEQGGLPVGLSSGAHRPCVEVQDGPEDEHQGHRHPDEVGKVVVVLPGVVDHLEDGDGEGQHGRREDLVGRRVRVFGGQDHGEQQPLPGAEQEKGVDQFGRVHGGSEKAWGRIGLPGGSC